MKKVIAVLTALAVLVVGVAPAGALSIPLPNDPDGSGQSVKPDPDPKAKNKKKRKKRKKAKKKPRWKITIKFQGVSTEIEDCRGFTHDKWRIKSTSKTVEEWSETGYHDGGGRRTGFRQITLTTESTDPTVGSGHQVLGRTPIEATIGKGQRNLQLNAKRTKFVHEFKYADGMTELVDIPAPKTVGQTESKYMGDVERKPPTKSRNGKCVTTSDETVSEEIRITRVQ